MENTINTKELRSSLPDLVKRIQRGERFTVLYRSRPAFRLVPIGEDEQELGQLAEDALFQAPAVGRSTDGLSSQDHDLVLYGHR